MYFLGSHDLTLLEMILEVAHYWEGSKKPFGEAQLLLLRFFPYVVTKLLQRMSLRCTSKLSIDVEMCAYMYMSIVFIIIYTVIYNTSPPKCAISAWCDF